VIQGECYIVPYIHDSNVYVFLLRSGELYSFINKETEERVRIYTSLSIIFFRASPVIREIYEAHYR